MEFLLVDDNEITLEIQKIMLESCGLSVVTADSGESAVDLAAKKNFFTIFMDINMPDMNGFRASELIRINDKKVPIIALSADKIASDDPDYIKSGMSGSLLKPLQMSDLKELLNRFISIDFGSETAETSSDTVFSYDELLAVMKDEKAILRLLKQFLSIHSSDCDMLSQFINSGDFASAREILHNITGISGNMFCKKLYSISCGLSEDLKQQKSGSLSDFVRIWNETFTELTEWQNKLSESDKDIADTADWESLRDNFVALCDDFDVAAADIFSENINTFMENISPENFKWLKKAVFSYDFSQISDNREVLYV